MTDRKKRRLLQATWCRMHKELIGHSISAVGSLMYMDLYYGYAGNCHDAIHLMGKNFSDMVLRGQVTEQFDLLYTLGYKQGSSLVCEMEATCERLRHVLRAMQGGA